MAITSNTDKDGIRIMRQGTKVCEEDDSKMMGFVVDVFCNEDVLANPPIHLVTPGSDDDDIENPCWYHVQLEHAAGCPKVSYVWGRRAIGTLLIGAGFILTYLRVKSMKWFMEVVVQLTVLFGLLAVFSTMGFLAIADPTAPPRAKSVPMGLTAVVVAFTAAFVARWLFKKFIKFGPTVIGCGAGYFATLYTVLIINGVCSVFQARNAASVIGDSGQALWALAGIIVGGYIGYNYAFAFILAVQTFVSAYMGVRGLSLWINYGFPNEVQLMEHAYGTEQGPPLEIPTMFYFYVTSIIGLWGASFYFAWQQIHKWPSSQELHDDD